MIKLRNTKLKLEEIMDSTNLADKIHKDDLSLIATEVYRGAMFDHSSRYDWEMMADEVVSLAKLESTPKHTPFENASNVKLPLTATATQQFGARAIAEVIKNGQVVHFQVAGDDPDNSQHQLGRAIQDHMNYQLLVETNEFFVVLDKLSHTYSLVGTMFTKTYYDPIKGRNAIELIPYKDFYIHKDTKSMETARRMTHVFTMHPNELLERMRCEPPLYVELDEKELENDCTDNEGTRFHEVYEQHCFLDLDGDGYEEPYVVTILSRTQKVLRIVARFTPSAVKRNYKGKISYIRPTQYFTDFHFLPNPDGSFYSIGYGQMLYHANDAANTLINQMINAGTLAHNPTGFIDGSVAARMPGGALEIQMGKIVKLQSNGMAPIRDAIHLLEYPPPNPVGLQLMEVILSSSKELISMNAPTLGSAQVQNVASSVMQSQLSNSLKVAEGIFERLVVSLQHLFERYFELNAMALPAQTQFMVPNRRVPISAEDYRTASIRIKPVANPRLASDTQRQEQSQMLLELLNNPALAPQLNPHGIATRIVESHRIDQPAEIIMTPDPNRPPPPDVLKIMSEIKKTEAEIHFQEQELQLKTQDVITRAHLADTQIDTAPYERMLLEAKAYSEKLMPHVEQQKVHASAIMTGMKGELDLQKEKMKADSKPKPKPKGDA